MTTKIAPPRRSGPPGFWPGRIFYGWMIVFISFWENMLSSGIGGYGFAVFLRPLSVDMGWSRAAISSVALIQIVMTMILAPLLGRYVDRRHGPQLLLVIGATVAGAALVLLAFVRELWQFYLLFGVIWGGAMTALGGMILGPTIVSKWFVRRRGRAMAIAAMGASAGGVVAIPLITVFILAFSWRAAWPVLGVVTLATILPLGAFFMRRQPEDIDLLPDGDLSKEAARQAGRQPGSAVRENIAVHGSFTVRQAFRSRPFWVLVIVQTMQSLAISPVLLHHMAYMQDKGFSLGTAALIGTMVAFFAGAGKVPWGVLAERIPIRYVIFVTYILAGSSLWLLIQAQSLSMLYAYSAIFGFSFGAEPVLSNIAWASYFGRDKLGSIRGFSTPLTQWTGGASPVFAGLVYDWLGTYNLAFILFSTAYMLGGVAMLMAGAPSEPPAAASAPEGPQTEWRPPALS